MSTSNRSSTRFSMLTALVWLLVAAVIIYMLWNVILLISSRVLPLSSPTPNLTQVYQTIAFTLNNSGTSLPPTSTHTDTPSPTTRLTQTPSVARSTSIKATLPADVDPTGTPETLCDRASPGNPIDITIPDDSEISPGESFIKTWKLVNSGSCTWTRSYSASFFYGERMGAPRLVELEDPVLPEQDTEISIEMVAPRSPGTYQGNWKLSNENGDLFGIGPNADSAFWVRIVVVEEETATPIPTIGVTPTITPTNVITPTETPQGDTSALLPLIPGDSIDLDALTLDGEGEDLAYQAGEDDYHWLTPQDSAGISIYGSQQPTLSDCQTAGMGSAPVAVESLSAGTYLCYTTNEGRLGRARLDAVNPENFTITLDLLTWALP